MSYKVTVYFNDENIASTKIYYPRGSHTVTRYYGDSAYSADGFDGTTQFTAYPADGCVFTKWLYRIGEEIYDDNIDPRESAGVTNDDGSNTFTYSGTEDIVIRAVGIAVENPDIPDEPDGSWRLKDVDLGAVTSEDYAYIQCSISENVIYRGSVYIVENGKASVTVATDGGDCTCYITSTTSWDITEGIPDDIITSKTFEGSNFLTFDADAYTTYYVWVRNDGIYSISTCYVYVTLTLPPVVAKWDWYSSNYSASEDETIAAYYAVINRDYTNEFSHDVWNDIVKKVDDVLVAKGLSWDATYATYVNTRMTIYPYELTADMFNSLRNNMELVGVQLGVGKITNSTTPDDAEEGTIPHPVKTDDIVFGHYFITLADYINECIDNL